MSPPYQLPAPRLSGRQVLYLDYDGVLHHENVLWHHKRGAYAGPPGFVLFEHAHILQELLRPYPDVVIVLSTSWVRSYGCYGTAKRLPLGLRERVIGATFHSGMNEDNFNRKLRGEQVLSDVVRRNPTAWFALDDTDAGWPDAHRGNVFITDEQLGVSAPGATEQIREALLRVFAPATTISTTDAP